MFSTISNEIYTIINSLVATTKLAAVYNYDVKTYDNVPVATITPLDTAETVLDTVTNMDVIPFRVRVVDKNKNVATMESRMRTLADEIIAELRKKENITLNGSVCNMTFWITWGWMDDQQPMRTFEIVCTVTTTNTII